VGTPIQVAEATGPDQRQEHVARAEPTAPELPVKEPVKTVEKTVDKPQAATGLRHQLQRFAKDRALSARPITRTTVSG
jgi:hypothetical protein